MSKYNVLLVTLLLTALGCSERSDNSVATNNNASNVDNALNTAEVSNKKLASLFLKINRRQYAQQLHGFWLGQSIANWTGLVTEMDKVGSKDTLPFYTSKDWGTKDLKAMWGEYVPHTDKIDFFFVQQGEPWGADDDTDIEYMYQYLHEIHQTSLLSAEQIQQGWLKHIYSDADAPYYKKFPNSKAAKENFLWESNQQAYNLMAQGMMPPATSEPENNSKYMMIDAQLTTEIFGLFAPGRPDVALDISYLPIRTSAKEDALWISQFYVVMHSLASKVDPSLSLQQQTQWLAAQARKQLPENSTVAKMYDFVKSSYDSNPNKSDWEKTRDEIYQRYQLDNADGYHYKDPFEAGINFSASLVSLFYGEGDIAKTIKIGTLTGWDSDNPTATWGGLLGFMIGKDNIEKAFKQTQLSDTYWIHRTRRNFPDHTPEKQGEDSFPKMAERALKVIDLVVTERMGGSINNKENVWIIPLKQHDQDKLK